MTPLNKLNGWQRLWLMCAAIWLIPVIIYTVTLFPIKTPTASELLHDSSYINANAATKAATFVKYFGRDSNYTGANEATKIAIRQRFGIESSLSSSTTEAEAIDVQHKSLLKIIALGFLAWVLPLVAIYVLGITIRWIYVGFRSK